MAFEGFTTDTRAFFLELAQHNEKSFFEANRTRFYDSVRDPMRALAAAVSDAVLDVDDTLDTRPERAVARIRRDTRFSRDKTLYRDHLWAGFRPAGQTASDCLGLYFELSAFDVAWGMGFYAAPPQQMARLRAAIVQKPRAFQKLCGDPALNAAFTLSGEDYKRLPAECDGASAALLPWLKKKNFYLEHAEAFEPGALDPALADRIRHDFRLLKPLYAFLQNAMTRTV